MKNNLKINKKIVLLIIVAIIIVVLYIILFISTSYLDLFSSSKTGQKELTAEEVKKRGGEIYYYGPDKVEVIYDPKHETPEDIEGMFKYWDEHPVKDQ